MSKEDLVLRGSKTARDGFKNERDIAEKFNNWESDAEAREWLEMMQYNLAELEDVKAEVISGCKADLKCHIKTKQKSVADVENIQIKLVSNQNGFNQIDKRWLRNYNELWDIPDDVYKVLQYFTGEIKPYKSGLRDKKKRRMFLDEMTEGERNLVVNWFSAHKKQILADILKGRGESCAEWVLVAQKLPQNARWVLKDIEEVQRYYGAGDVCISPRGSMKLGKVGIQRKGGDNGRETANMLQFKIDPTELFDI